MFLHFGPFMETKGQLKIRQKFNMMVMLDASIDNLIFVMLAEKKRLSEILHNVRVMTTDETNSIGPVCCWHCRFFGSPAGLGFPAYSAGAGASVLFDCQSVWVFEWQASNANFSMLTIWLQLCFHIIKRGGKSQ